MVNAEQFLSELESITEQYRKTMTTPHARWRPLADLLVDVIMADVGKEITEMEARGMALCWNDMSDYVRNRLFERLGME